jgi:undecaprenyl-diphosphatase
VQRFAPLRAGSDCQRPAAIVTFFIAALLGIVQGLTEFLPISSTAHLLLGGEILGYDDDVFTVMIQLGSILAVMWLYRRKIWSVVAGLHADSDARRFTLMLIVACLPAFVAGAFLADFVQTVLYESLDVIAWALVLGGVVMLLVERHAPEVRVRDAERTPVARAFGIGVCQMLALIPGVSRSGATIVGGRLLGLDRAAAAEFSFFLAMPTMVGAFAYELLEVREQLAAERAAEIGIGFVMAFAAALVVVRPFLRYVARSGFAPFAWYRIGTGAAILAALGADWL